MNKNNQKAFNIVYTGILQQGGLSMNEARCVYRSNSGRKCAAGWLIPDSKYHKGLEIDSNTGRAWLANEGPIQEILSEEGYDPEFVRLLQQIHDDNTLKSIDSWKEQMQIFAKNNGLTIPDEYQN